MSQLPTVKVKASSERGWRIINQSAFDPSAHELFVEAQAVAEPVAIEVAAVVSEVQSEPASAADDPNPKRGPGRPKRSQ